LAPLFAELDERRRFFCRIVRPARTQFLERFETASVRDEAGDGLDPARFGELVVFPLRLHRALHGLYHEGREPVLEQVPTDVGELLSANASLHAAKWEHVRVAHSVAAFLRFQSLARPRGERSAGSRDYGFEVSSTPS
jgi:hypothetical protein